MFQPLGPSWSTALLICWIWDCLSFAVHLRSSSFLLDWDSCLHTCSCHHFCISQVCCNLCSCSICFHSCILRRRRCSAAWALCFCLQGWGGASWHVQVYLLVGVGEVGGMRWVRAVSWPAWHVCGRDGQCQHICKWVCINNQIPMW